MADGAEDDVGGVAGAALQIAAAELAIGLHVPDDGFYGRAAAQLALDDAEHAALLARDEDPAWISGIVATIALVDIGALDSAAGELLGRGNDGSERRSGRPADRVSSSPEARRSPGRQPGIRAKRWCESACKKGSDAILVQLGHSVPISLA
jgi:hypothetical protein